MKLIHCADLHLDSPMEANLPPEKARERKSEILSTFTRLVRLAAESGVNAILIAGDLFDSQRVTLRTQKYVLDLISSVPELSFFYLAGNHDKGNALSKLENRPENLLLFGDSWTSYRMGGVTITGSERPSPDTLRLEESQVNIVLLHGQERAGRGVDKADLIRFAHYKDKHIDYLALGHLHDYRATPLDARTLACYSGCLEGRGFDECGKKGYVLLEVDQRGRVFHRFVPFAKRRLHARSCDVTDISSQLELENRVLKATEGIPATDLVKVTLTGGVRAHDVIDRVHLSSVLADQFYFAKINDETRLQIDPAEFANDVSLKGEFVRRVLASNLSETEKERVIACGFRALSGEELGL